MMAPIVAIGGGGFLKGRCVEAVTDRPALAAVEVDSAGALVPMPTRLLA